MTSFGVSTGKTGTDTFIFPLTKVENVVSRFLCCEKPEDSKVFGKNWRCGLAKCLKFVANNMLGQRLWTELQTGLALVS